MPRTLIDVFHNLSDDVLQNHSEVPERDEDWPVLDTIMGFRDGVRERLACLYEDLQTGKRKLTRNIARTLIMTLEHEAWHVEVRCHAQYELHPV